MKINFPFLSYKYNAGFIFQTLDINLKNKLLQPCFILLCFLFPLVMESQTLDVNSNYHTFTDALDRTIHTEKEKSNIPICVNPENPKCFLFRSKPLVFLTATEHYGAVMNRPFRFDRYLRDAAEKHMTLTRLFLLFRELQSTMNPYSTCKPESPDYIAPFLRTGPSKALDGQPKYNLDRWNPEFFERLQRFLSMASDYGIIVEITLLSNTYSPNVWALNPLNSANNLNGIEEIEWPDYLTMRHPKLFERQMAYVRKIVECTKKYDNIIYEICNEPGGAFPGKPSYPKPDEVNRWQMAIAKVIQEAEANLPYKHLIVGQEAFTYAPWEQPSDKSFGKLSLDVVNIHPLPNTTYRGKSYNMGEFMSKELKLGALRDYCLATYNDPKPLNFDEDNVASQYKDLDGWTIHRKRAWVTLLSGGNYDFIDFSIINYSETGTENSQRYIRTWFKHLSEYIHSVDIVHARPLTGWLKKKPQYTLEAVFAVEGQDYSIYLADDRELGEPGAGTPIRDAITLDLPPGEFKLSCYSPVTGLYSLATRVVGGKNLRFDLPEFQNDIVVRITKVK